MGKSIVVLAIAGTLTTLGAIGASIAALGNPHNDLGNHYAELLTWVLGIVALVCWIALGVMSRRYEWRTDTYDEGRG